MFPKDSGEIGFADLSQARQLPWYPQLAAQVVPVALFEFEKFLETVQMRETSPLNQVVWATVSPKAAIQESTAPERVAPRSGQTVAVGIGDFDAETIKSYLDSHKVPSISAGNYTLYSSGMGVGSSNVYFALLDSQTIAFGPLEALKRVLQVRDGEEDSLLQNAAMMTLIENASGNGMFWGVLDAAGAARAIERMVPEAGKFPQSRELIGKLREVLIKVNAADGVEVEFQATSPSLADAALLSQLLQAGILLRQYQASSGENPDLSAMLNTVSVRANGNLLDISLQLTNDQLVSLIEHNSFSIRM